MGRVEADGGSDFGSGLVYGASGAPQYLTSGNRLVGLFKYGISGEPRYFRSFDRLGHCMSGGNLLPDLRLI
ncbi:hypothetical protein AMTR_s00047p00035450 [Amborella trichopoda]|uniref:Uncharacterized protein n=1 Tax=Amborella trichopoda TaxID=13333 RepID=U5D5K6_AMBTC|nr:hypothetical protein AMTR_s00047p00035450 [Amborella trichopoda]